MTIPSDLEAWQKLVMTGEIRDKFLEWTPEDVKEEVKTVELFEELYSFYTPHNHPDNNFSENLYCDEMLRALIIQRHYI